MALLLFPGSPPVLHDEAGGQASGVSAITLFSFITEALNQLSRLLVPWKCFQPSLIFVRMAPQRPWIGSYSQLQKIYRAEKVFRGQTL